MAWKVIGVRSAVWEGHYLQGALSEELKIFPGSLTVYSAKKSSVKIKLCKASPRRFCFSTTVLQAISVHGSCSLYRQNSMGQLNQFPTLFSQ